MEKVFGKYTSYVQGLIALAVLGILTYGAYRLYVWAKEGQTAPPAEDALQPNPSNVSLSANELTSLAAQLESAMNGNGTAHPQVIAVLNQIKNRDEWYALVKAFGQRENAYGGVFGETGNLYDWLRWEYYDSYNWFNTGRGDVEAFFARLGLASPNASN